MGAVLDVSGAVTLDGAGAGVVRFAPGGNRRWTITAVSVNRLSGTGSATARVWRDAIGGRLVDGTYSADLDRADGLAELVFPGQALLVQFTDGTPGEQFRASLTGTED